MSEHHKENFITKYVFTQDHKMIAKQFLITGMFMAVVGMLMSAIFRVQLANPGETSILYNLLPGAWLNDSGGLNPDKYLALVTMHGTILVFWVLTAGLSGTFANFLIPLQIGARDMASGFLNMLVAARDKKVKRFIFAASSSTYGDSKELPKIEDKIGKPLSPYAITKYVNELYADIFSKSYGLQTIGLRYFNVFGRRQDPNGAYAAVIPLFVKQLMNYKSPLINGDGSYSRDFTYIDNVIQMNILAITTNCEKAINQVYNTAVGDRTTLIELVNYLKKHLSEFDPKIKDVVIKYGTNREGDIPHSLASVDKAKKLLKYNPSHQIDSGIKESIKWYYKNL